MILDKISDNNNIKKLSEYELDALCCELRGEIIRLTEKNGGHLGSNLGAIEIIVALHYVFDLSIDKLIFDVGHQAYAHKLLTSRRELMENLRNFNGASGFPDPNESSFDHFIAGHASTSLSAALGIAAGRDIKGENFHVLSVLGDGSLSGGMIYEALNNVSNTKNFIVILNDNQMSISRSVGAMRRYLSKLLISKSGLTLRKNIRNYLNKLPNNLAKPLENFLKRLLSVFKGSNIFEELGLQYIGPVDGNNVFDMISVLKNVKSISNYKPVIIHTVTKKGCGLRKAEEDCRTNLHNISQKTKGKTYTQVFEEKIVELAYNDDKIVCITAAMKDGTGLNTFAEKFPNRFFDVGIAEEHAVTFAAGLAKQGLKPFVCIYSSFLQRAFDQIFHDVVLQNLPVRFIIDKAGFPGNDGKTHEGLFDINLLANFEEITMLAPSSSLEFSKMLDFAKNYENGPLTIRFPKATAFDESKFIKNSNDLFEKNIRVIQNGKINLILSVGACLENVLLASQNIDDKPTILDTRFINPFDFDTFLKYAKNHDKITIIEEGIFGGILNIILEYLLKNQEFETINKISVLSASKKHVSHTSRSKQIEENFMSPEDIAKIIKIKKIN